MRMSILSKVLSKVHALIREFNEYKNTIVAFIPSELQNQAQLQLVWCALATLYAPSVEAVIDEN